MNRNRKQQNMTCKYYAKILISTLFKKQNLALPVLTTKIACDSLIRNSIREQKHTFLWA